MIPFAVTADPSNEQLSFLKDYPWLGVVENRVRVRLESFPVVPEALVRDRMADAMKTHEATDTSQNIASSASCYVTEVIQ